MVHLCFLHFEYNRRQEHILVAVSAVCYLCACCRENSAIARCEALILHKKTLLLTVYFVVVFFDGDDLILVRMASVKAMIAQCLIVSFGR